ncbi:MAG: hypothetical protein RLN96_11785, partial [Pseudomonadales bacterium]
MMAIKNYPVGTSEYRIVGISTDRVGDDAKRICEKGVISDFQVRMSDLSTEVSTKVGCRNI